MGIGPEPSGRPGRVYRLDPSTPTVMSNLMTLLERALKLDVAVAES